MCCTDTAMMHLLSSLPPDRIIAECSRRARAGRSCKNRVVQSHPLNVGLEPRARQAPDGPKEGGTQSTDISVINRRVLLAPALPRDAEQEDEENAKQSVA